MQADNTLTIKVQANTWWVEAVSHSGRAWKYSPNFIFIFSVFDELLTVSIISWKK